VYYKKLIYSGKSGKHFIQTQQCEHSEPSSLLERANVKDWYTGTSVLEALAASVFREAQVVIKQGKGNMSRQNSLVLR